MNNQIDIIMGQHAALAAIENLKRVIISLKCTKEFFEKNKFVIENRGIDKLYIVSRRVIENINKNKIKVYKNYVGRYATSMEMAGMSVTVLKLNENIKKNLIAPSNCPFWTN